MKSYELITILGPTASGKTTFAAALAAQLDTEIISADSRQIYRSMDIGTGKDLADYNVNGKQIPYHLIDICEPGYKYNVFEYQHDFFRVYEDMKRRGKLPILCGGTGMYIEAVLKGYKLLDVPQNPELRESLRNKTLEELETILASYKILHNKTDVDTAQRAIRAIEIEADAMLLAKAIDGIYDSDPKVNPDAKKYDEISIQEIIDKKLMAVDLTASIMCLENKMPMLVFGLNEENSIVETMTGTFTGTKVTV
mgnify:CR=1 FL=1